MFIVFRSSPGGGVLHGRDLRHERVKKVYQCTHTIPQLLFNDFVIAIKHHFLRGRKQQNDKTRQLTIQPSIYYLIYSGVRKVFSKIIQHKET